MFDAALKTEFYNKIQKQTDTYQATDQSHCYHLCKIERTRTERTVCLSGHLSIENTIHK